MKKKPLNETEIEQLNALLKRAIHNGQFGLVAARPFPKGFKWRESGFPFNDMLNGPTSFDDGLRVCVGKRLPFGEDTPPRPELEVYIPQKTISFLNSDQF
jgi:hypothetical protein